MTSFTGKMQPGKAQTHQKAKKTEDVAITDPRDHPTQKGPPNLYILCVFDNFAVIRIGSAEEIKRVNVT